MKTEIENIIYNCADEIPWKSHTNLTHPVKVF